MLTRCCTVVLLWLLAGLLPACVQRADAQVSERELQIHLKNVASAPNDALLSEALAGLSSVYWGADQEKAMQYAQQALHTGQKADHKMGIAKAYNSLGVIHGFAGSYEIASNYFFKALSLREEIKDSAGVASTLSNIGILYIRQKKYDKSLKFQLQAEKYQIKGTKYRNTCSTKSNIAFIYNLKNMPDSALYYLTGIDSLEHLLTQPFWSKYHLRGDALALKGLYQEALVSYDSVFPHWENVTIPDRHMALAGKANVYAKLGQHREAMRYATQLLASANGSASLYERAVANGVMSKVLREASRFGEALQYLDIARQLEDSLHMQDAARQLESLQMHYRISQKQQENDRLQQDNRWITSILLSGMLILLITLSLLVLLYRINRKRLEALQQIGETNRSLEEMVASRTRELTRRNKQLIDYAYLNSHQVRGPLARLMGLVYLLKQGWWDRDKEELIDLIDVSASELDKVIQEINHHLTEEEANLNHSNHSEK